jgi:hypothetical protein
MLLAIQSIYIDVDLSPPQARVFSAITENEEPWLMGKHRNLEAAIS